MLMPSLRFALLALTATVAAAQSTTTTPGNPTVVPVMPVISTEIPLENVVTRSATIQLGLPSSIVSAVPFAAPPPLTFVRGTRLQLLALSPGAKYGPVQWFKDGKPLTFTGETLEFASATSADSGVYSVSVKTATGGTADSAQARVLITREGQRLANASTRVQIDAAHPSFLFGFVVEPGPGEALVLLRAVGPTLALFGVKDGLAAPQLTLFNARGEPPVTTQALPWVYPSVSQATQSVGAFALPAGSKDVAQLFALRPGAYTVQVSAADNGSGTALLELYDVPY